MKKIFGTILAAALCLALTVPAFAGVWQYDGKGWWYDNQDGTYEAHGWSWINGNNDGVAECYYFDDNGYLLVNTVTPDGYTVNADGQWVEGGQVQTSAVDPDAGYTYDASSRVYSWMNGVYLAQDGRTINLDAAGGTYMAVQFYCYSEDGWNTSFLSGPVDENLHAILVNDNFDQNGEPTVYYRLNIDGEATEIWVQTYDMAGNYVGSWYDGWYYKTR